MISMKNLEHDERNMRIANDETTSIKKVINQFAKTWTLLLQYDEDSLARPKTLHSTRQTLQVVRVAGMCRLALPLTDGQKRYLTALNLSEADLIGSMDGGKELKRL